MKITKGESGWIKRSLGKNALSKIKKVEDEKREAAMTDDERAKLTAAKKTARDAMPGSIAGAAAAQTATLNESAINAQTLSNQPTVIQSNSGQASGGELSGYPPPPPAPIVFPAPAGPDRRSSMDRF
jgi:hypothetical protein